jgi:hypothetical protein
MLRPLRIFLIALLLVAACGCSSARKLWPFKPPPKATRFRGANPERVGTVILVNEEERFALVDFGMRDVPEQGAALKVFGEGTETAVLAVGDVRKRPFVAADIVKGMPRKGDLVFK